MPQKQRNKLFIINLSITITCWVVVMLVLFPSCSSNNKQFAGAIEERDSLPSMRTLGVTTLVSDSGITRYKIITEEWLIYDRKNPPYWAFEKGVYLEKFDSLFQVDANIKADTAYYFTKKELWELRGNVLIKNQKGEQFETQLLFWDQGKEQVYSDEFIRIQQEDKIITGYGFDSNQQLTKYRIRNSSGIFPVDETPVPNDSIKNDSIR